MPLKFVITTSCCVLLLAFARRQDCIVLKGGWYYVNLTHSPIQKNYTLYLDGDTFVKISAVGDTIKGRLTWGANCELRFVTNFAKDTEKTQDIPGWGDLYYRLENVSGDTTSFRTTYPGNLHVTQETGQFIKIKK